MTEAPAVRSLSVVIPVYNGAATIERLVRTVLAELADLEPEIVLVDDGSKDESAAACEALATASPTVRFLGLRRNFGEHNAVMCGLAHSTGEYVAVIDDDFQNPPAEIRSLLRRAVEGYDVVYGDYREKRHALWRNLGSRLHDRLATLALGKPKDLYLSSFKVMSRGVVDEIVKYRGPFPYVDALLLRVTDRYCSVRVEHRPSERGRSNYTLGRLISLSLDMLFLARRSPLRRCLGLGAFALMVALAAGAATTVAAFLRIDRLWVLLGAGTTTAALIAGALLLLAGIAGESAFRARAGHTGAPQWAVRKRVN